MSENPQAGQGYGIGAVARLTGLSTHVLRIWERRYGAVVAERAPNGRRIYQPEDVEKLQLLKALTDRGTSISTIANLGLETLRERALEMEGMQTQLLPEEVRVGVLGTILPALLDAELTAAHRIRVVASDANHTRFQAEIELQRPDLLLLEMPTLDAGSAERAADLGQACDADAVIVVYGFGRRADEQAVLRSGMRLIRMPASPDEIVAAALAAAAGVNPSATPARPVPPDHNRAPAPGAAPPRRFSEQQLTALSRLQTGVDCECTRHLTEIIRLVSAFELYSRECESRNAADAALHAYLYRSSADARARMEDALARLLETEGIEP